MLSITTNTSSLIVQKSLKTSTNKLNQAIERMSTGSKINRAKDNAANYLINTQLTTKIGAYSIAEENAMMGLDIVQTASSTLDLMSDLAIRLRALSVQARNGTYGTSSISALRQEANAITTEIKRLSNSAQFNNISVLTKVDVNLASNLPIPKSNGFIGEIIEDTPDVIVLNPDELLDAISNNTKIGISNAETLAMLTTIVNAGTTCQGKTFILTEDIDISAYKENGGWIPIGSADNYFQGVFNGNGHKIINLTINRPNTKYQGIFGYTYGATIKNLASENVKVVGSEDIGGLVGFGGFSTTIENCYTTGVVQDGLYAVGGLAGACSIDYNVRDCYSTCNVTGKRYDAGGFVGVISMNGTVSNCFATGDVYCSTFYGGGLFGLIRSRKSIYTANIDNCYAFGNVKKSTTGCSGSFVGGIELTEDLVNYGTVNFTNCHALEQSNIDLIGGCVQYPGTDEKYFFSYDMSAMLAGIRRFSNTLKTIQVGINGDGSSRLELDTSLRFNFNALDVDITSNHFLYSVDNLLELLTSKQTEIGVVENRLTSAIEHIGVAYNNLVSTQSIIRNTDIADVSSEYLKMQILQQASATLLATANQTPTIALQLL